MGLRFETLIAIPSLTFPRWTVQLRHDRPTTFACYRRTDIFSQAVRAADSHLGYMSSSYRGDLLVRAIDAGISRCGAPDVLGHWRGGRDCDMEMGEDARKA